MNNMKTLNRSALPALRYSELKSATEAQFRHTFLSFVQHHLEALADGPGDPSQDKVASATDSAINDFTDIVTDTIASVTTDFDDTSK